MNARAEDISTFQWTPLLDLHKGNAYYNAGTQYRGIPYSSVKEIDTYVGIETSFYTFSTSVGNPRSVLYTENIYEAPYHGTNCSLYYGTVCSTTIEYALGIDIPYATNMMDTLSIFSRKTINDPSNTEIGDVLLSKGHVVLVTNIKKNKAGNIKTVQILESSKVGTQARMQMYSYESFCSRWEKLGWIAYTYNGIENVVSNETIPHTVISKQICPNKGDRSCYRYGEDVVINSLTADGAGLQLYKDNSIVRKIDLMGNSDYVLKGLQEGKYSVLLVDKDQVVLDSCLFDVINCDISIEAIEDHNLKVILPQTRFIPYYVVLVDIHGNRFSLNLISEKEICDGYKIISIPSINSKIYCKVMMKSEFGQISNIPLKIN